MSKTDKTRPWDVKALDRPAYLVEVHDHRFGPCDLPALPRRAEGVGHAPAPGGRCFWGISRVFWASKDGRCGCSWCSGSFEFRAERRRDRQAARRALRRWRDGDDW